MRLKQFLILFLASCLTFIPLLSGCIDSDDDVETETITGKVAQEHVANATVFWDLNSNFKLDPKEEKYSTTTSPNGSFEVTVPKNTLSSEMLVAINGTVGDSDRKSLIMVAPKEEKIVSKDEADNVTNITPVTTLVNYVPNLQEDIGDDWNADIASKDGVNGKILQLALSAESMQSALANAGFPTDKQIATMSQFASNLEGKDLNKKGNIVNATRKTLKDYRDTIVDSTSKTVFKSLNSTIMSGVETVCDNVNANDWVKEADVQEDIGNRIYFDPLENVFPMPNDIVWKKVAKKDEYKPLIEGLGLQGLSPNTPISIPLLRDTDLDTLPNIHVLDLKNLTGAMYKTLTGASPSSSMSIYPQNATPEAIFQEINQLSDAQMAYFQESLIKLWKNFEAEIELTQDGSYIKGFPTEPLDPGKRYLVVVEDTTGSKLQGNAVFDLLKSTDEIPGEKFAELEKMRERYQVFFDYYLKSLELDREDVLEAFTFTTADKTLRLTDFQALKTGKSGDIQGLELNSTVTYNPPADTSVNNTKDEYVAMASTIQLMGTPKAPELGSVNSSKNTFTSWKVETIPSANKTVHVPYTMFNNNKDTYNSSNEDVVIFQHGIYNSKEKAKAFAQEHTSDTVVSMDLPLHGERSLNPENSGAGYFNASLAGMANNRINMYQSYYDMTVFLKALEAGNFDLNGDGSADTPSNIYFVGNSLGSLLGATVVQNNPNSIDKAVLNTGGANLASILDQTKLSKLAHLLENSGYKKNSTSYSVFLGMMQLLMDPADPVNWVEDLSSNSIVTVAYNDTIVSNTSSAILGNLGKMDLELFEYLPPYQENLYNNPTSGKEYIFGGQDPTEEHWLPHSFMLTPDYQNYDAETKAHFKPAYVEDGYESVNELIDNYLSN